MGSAESGGDTFIVLKAISFWFENCGVDSVDRVESYFGLFHFLDISRFPRHVNRRTCFAATNGNRVERLDPFLHRHSSAATQSLLQVKARIESSSLNYVFLLALGIGIVAGLRSLTAPAVVAWGAYLSWLNLHGSPLAFMGSTTAVGIFSVLAIGELVADKLPMIPKRTAPAPLMARIITGGLCGACLCASAGQSLVVGAFLGGIGAVVGAFLGYGIRRRLDLHINDLVVAVCEDVAAVGLALFVVSR
jgi:uncharacterized membrane protein